MAVLPTKILAALDIGTNSSLFLLAQVDRDGSIKPLLHDVRTNDLGRGLDAEGYLTPETIELNLGLLREFKAMADRGGAEEFRLVATEALRQARNAQDLINRAHRELGLSLRLLSGAQEADLTYQGVLSGFSPPLEQLIVVDVGGGSTEICRGQGSTIVAWASLPLGAVSLDKAFIQHDPPRPEEIDSIRQHIHLILKELPRNLLERDLPLVICGGTASALASIALKMNTYQPDKISGYRMTKRRLQTFLQQFSFSTLEQRRLLPGLGRRRAEIILPGTLIIAELLTCLRRIRYLTSERGLRYGVLLTPAWGKQVQN